MPRYEYKVIPAPKKGLRAKGVRGTELRFANTLQEVMNEHGAQGWEYQRTDTLPCEERQGLTGKTTGFQNMLVFRRVIEEAVVELPNVAAAVVDEDLNGAANGEATDDDIEEAEIKQHLTLASEEPTAANVSEIRPLGGVTKDAPALD